MDEPEASTPAAGNEEADPVRARVAVEERVLLLMKFSEDAALAAGEVEQIGVSALICRSVEEFIHAIVQGAGAAVISDEVLGEGIAELFRVFDGQSTWSDMPVIVLVREEGPPELMAMLRAFERHPKIKTTFLQRPVPAMSLISAIRSGLKARHRQYQVRDLLEQLNDDVRMRDEFLAMLGHELRNPVASIGYVAELFEMSDGLLTPDRLKWGADVINRQVRQLSRLLDQLLDVARVQSGKIELDAVPLDLRSLAAQCLDSFEENAKHRSLALSLPERPVMVCGDRVRLTQIIDNLLSNAFKYTEDGGHIGLSVQSNGHATLTVTDDGRGIEKSAMEHVFEPFFQEGGSRGQGPGGLGLGLAMVENLVRLHGGTVKVSSKGAGCGAEFEMRLPLVSANETADPATNGKPLHRMSRRLLIIEDNADLAEAFSIILKELGYEPHVICKGEQGVEEVSQRCPDLVFIDIGLPDIDGHEVARRIRNKLGSGAPPLVALSGYPQCDEADLLFDEYLLKPLGRERVETLIRKLT